MTGPDIYLPNNGQTKLVRRPVDLDHVYHDPDTDLPILLIATRAVPLTGPAATKLEPRNTHWKLAWAVGTNSLGLEVQRQVHIIHDLGVDHLTNWGAITKISEGHTKAVEVATKSLDVRRRLEGIALNTPVRRPDGMWNCQDWIITVLEASEKDGLFTHQEWSSAIAAVSSV